MFPDHMLLFFLGFAVLGVVGALEKLVRQQWGVVLGVPIGTLDEAYVGTIENPRAVDLDPHLYDVGRVEWVDDSRVMLLPLHGEVDMYASARARSTSMASGFMCVGDLRIDAPRGTIRFRTRVLVRIVPLLGAMLFMFGPYVPAPWGMDWPLPGSNESGKGDLWLDLGLELWPLILFGGLFSFTAIKARTGVISAHHAVTSAFMATLQPGATRDHEPRGG